MAVHRLKSVTADVDKGLVTVVEELPALTGSPLLDPWRIRGRLALAGALEPPPRRQGETLSERILWGLLEDEAPGWHREYTTGPYRLDFYCPLARLAVEVDGGSHYGREAAERDALRDEWHRLRGITTKRFSASEVEREAAWVLGEVQLLVRELCGQEPVKQEAAPVAEASDPRIEPDVPLPPPLEVLQELVSAVVLEEEVVDGVLEADLPIEAAWAAACRDVLPEQRRLLAEIVRMFD